jgi:peroxiredoxin
MNPPAPVKLDRGIHVMHLFYRVNHTVWAQLAAGASAESLRRLETFGRAHAAVSHPRVMSYANLGGKADLAFILFAADLGGLGQMHRDLEACFPPATLERVFTYLSLTELTEYMPGEEDYRARLAGEKLEPGTAAYEKRWAELLQGKQEYEHYRLYPELQDWPVMSFYPMSKRRAGADNWYSLDFAARKKLMGGHARVGRKYSGRVSQLITGSTGIDDWEWGVTLVAHQADALKEIVYEMRFDEVTARFGEFGPFYLNLRLEPAALWPHLHL